MSFGPPIRVVTDQVSLVLRAPKREEMADFAERFSSARVHQWTMGGVSMTAEDEEAWYDRSREDPSLAWVIQPDGVDYPIGVTSLNRGRAPSHVWSSGTIVADPGWWGKGVTTAGHLARTWFAATQVPGLMVIRSEVRVPNEASWKALERVGYLRTGMSLRDAYRDGAFHDTYQYTWVHPHRLGLLYPNGVPDIEGFAEAQEKAQLALDRAEQEGVITLL